MKLKYLLRGLGIGLLFTALLFIIRKPGAAAPTLTDEEIMERARKLGMYTEKEYQDKRLEESLEKLEESSGPKKTQEPSEKTPEATAAPTASPQATQTPVPALPSETPSPSPKPTRKPEKKPAATPEPTKKPEYVTFTIKAGMFSERVSEGLKQAGVIRDASDFNRYLTENGYASRLRVGTYQIPLNASYQEIARIIT